MNDHAYKLRHPRVNFGDGRRDVVRNRAERFLRRSPGKGFPAGERLVANHAEREDVGGGSGLFQLRLFGRHVLPGAFMAGERFAFGELDHAEIDDLRRIVVHDEDVAGLQIAMDQAVIVSDLQTPADLGDDLDDPFEREARTGTLDELGQGRAMQKRHDEEGLAGAAILDFTNVAEVDDIGVAQTGENVPFLGEQLDGEGVHDVAHGFYGDIAAGLGVEGAIHDSHAALAQGLL